jgi:uncharacterized protein YceH (UPF0502 family)
MSESAPSHAPAASWSALTPTERRVAGVLVEKAKTTPDVYPLSLNALRVGCNQKNNRDPVTQYEDDDVQRAIDSLREKRAAMEVQGGARVPKYRHLLYDWLGVDKVEIAVMAELLLRGPQTEGELRARAARMELIADLAALRPVLEGLKARGLVISLTPEGRGHVVTHGLYREPELARLRQEYAAGAAATSDTAARMSDDDGEHESPVASAPRRESSGVALASLQREVAELRSQLESLQQATDSRLAALEQRMAQLMG